MNEMGRRWKKFSGLDSWALGACGWEGSQVGRTAVMDVLDRFWEERGWVSST